MTNTLEQFETLCRQHDLTYQYSDDGSVYRRGRAEYSAIRSMAAQLPRPDAVRIWNAVVDTKIVEGSREQFYWRLP